MCRGNEFYEYWLACVKGITSSQKRKLREMFGTEKELFYIEETGYKSCMLLTEKECENLRENQRNGVMDARKREWEKARKNGMRIVTYFSAEYPERLRQIPDPPYALFGMGPDCFRFPKGTAAIVGARSASPYGLKMAYEFGKNLSASGIYIISGMARGVDGEGIRGALDGSCTAVAVLGCGADVCYPRENRGLYEALKKTGGILSEYPPGTPPLAWNFPPRNRIISGLSDIVLVMEAKERSGSLITADFALEQGKDVYALPGPVTSVLSKGCNRLIRQGAGILLSPEELLLDLPYEMQKKVFQNVKNSEENEIKLESPEKLLYSLLCLYPKSLSELEEESGFSRGKTMEILLQLELAGWVQEISKNYYIRLK